MAGFVFMCTPCEAGFEPGPDALRCTGCAGPLTVDYGTDGPSHLSRSGSPLPVEQPESMISLGEGETPVVELERLSSDLGIGSLVAKLESSNPTGSFKDRGTAVMMSALAERGVGGIVEDSSGNAGASVAAYAARAAMRAHIFVPDSAPGGKVSQIEVFGAQVHRIAGPRERAAEAAARFVAETGLAYASHNLSPFFIEGTKSCAYEMIGQLGGRLPEHVVVPVGNGSLFIALHLALSEMRDGTAAGYLPKLHAVQSSAVMPIVAARSGRQWTPEPAATTIAGGIASAAPPRMDQILEALADSGGAAVAVGDEDILRWRALLARREGVYAEPTSAAAFAGLERLVQQGEIGGGERVLVPVTGAGLKDP